MGNFTVDFITQEPWQMVLVEEGPWTDVPLNLRRLQDRLYSCLDAAIDGQLAAQFPSSAGANVTIRLDCYNLPEEDLARFFHSFSSAVLDLPDYKAALQATHHVSGIQFALNVGDGVGANNSFKPKPLRGSA